MPHHAQGAQRSTAAARAPSRSKQQLGQPGRHPSGGTGHHRIRRLHREVWLEARLQAQRCLQGLEPVDTELVNRGTPTTRTAAYTVRARVGTACHVSQVVLASPGLLHAQDRRAGCLVGRPAEEEPTVLLGAQARYPLRFEGSTGRGTALGTAPLESLVLRRRRAVPVATSQCYY